MKTTTIYALLFVLLCILMPSCRESPAVVLFHMQDGTSRSFSANDDCGDMVHFMRDISAKPDLWDRDFLYNGRRYKVGVALASFQEQSDEVLLECSVGGGKRPSSLTDIIRKKGLKTIGIFFQIQEGVSVGELCSWLDAIPPEVEIYGLGFMIVPRQPSKPE